MRIAPSSHTRHPAAALGRLAPFLALGCLAIAAVAADPSAAPPPVPPLPDMGASVLRLAGSLFLVIGLFLAGVWVFKNMRHFARPGGPAPKLRVLESRALGNRNGLHVVAYDRQRMLVASSPAGLTLLSPLPDQLDGEPEPEPVSPGWSNFAQQLQQVLSRKP